MRFRHFAISGSAAALGTAGLLAWLAGQQLTQRPELDAYTNPTWFGLPFEPVSFSSRNDGVTLRGWFIPAEDARGTVIFCPGHTGSMHSDLVYVPGTQRTVDGSRGRTSGHLPAATGGIQREGDWVLRSMAGGD